MILSHSKPTNMQFIAGGEERKIKLQEMDDSKDEQEVKITNIGDSQGLIESGCLSQDEQRVQSSGQKLKILTIHDRVSDSISNKWEKKTVELGATFERIAMSPDKTMAGSRNTEDHSHECCKYFVMFPIIVFDMALPTLYIAYHFVFLYY